MSVRSRLEGVSDLARPVVADIPAQEQDPSMPGVPTVAAPTVALVPVEEAPAPVVEAPPAPVEIPEKRHEWQPTDEDGDPIGGVQVILYRTEQEKFEKMQEKTVLLLRQLRKERREKALGVPEERSGGEEFNNIVEFKPRELSPDERFKLSQDIANPETFADARDRLIESALGAKPSVLASTLNDTQKFIIQQRAVENYLEFVRTSGFVDSMKNRELVTGWIGTRNLAPTVANFVLAHNRLREAGLLQEAPVVQQEKTVPAPAQAAVVPVEVEPKPQVPAVPAPRIEGETQPQAKRQSHVPSGLNASIASSAGSAPVAGTSLTLADIDKMPADEYKQRTKDPAFVKLVNQLEADALKRRQARANG